MTKAIDFLVGGIKSSPRFKLGPEIEFLFSALDYLPKPSKEFREKTFLLAEKAGGVVDYLAASMGMGVAVAEAVRGTVANTLGPATDRICCRVYNARDKIEEMGQKFVNYIEVDSIS